MQGEHVAQLTSILNQLHDGHAVLVTLEDPGAVLHVVDPAPDRQVRAARVEGLGSHNDLQDHARVTLKCLTQQFYLVVKKEGVFFFQKEGGLFTTK